MKVTG